jgi:hypothetical protein
MLSNQADKSKSFQKLVTFRKMLNQLPGNEIRGKTYTGEISFSYFPMN